MGHFFGTSKIARKFVWLFLVCAFLPTFILLFISYGRVSDQFIDQNIGKLIKETKTYGLSLYERLVRMSEQLQFFARLIERDGLDNVALIQERFPELTSIFTGLILYFPDTNQSVSIAGDTDGWSAVLAELSVDFNGGVAIHKRFPDYGPAILYLGIPVPLPSERFGYLLATASPDYLWGVGTVPLLPVAAELTIYDEHGRQLIGGEASSGARLVDLTLTGLEHGKGFDYLHDGERYLAGIWGLFLDARFGSGTWTIVLGQPESYLLGSLKDFKRNLVLAILLGMWLILFLSLLLIRRGFAPLQALQERTQRIAAKDFTGEMSLATGDEFEELAQSFNTMSRELGKQFAALEAIDKIDRAILSSITLPDIIMATLPMLRDFFTCDMVVLGLVSGRSEYHVKAHVLGEGDTEPFVEHIVIDEGRRKTLFTSPEPFLWPQGLGGIERFSILNRYDAGTIVSMALLQDLQVKGIIILAHRRPHTSDAGELRQLRQLGDQITIALSNCELVENLEKMVTGTIEALARTVDAKSKWTSGHSERVSLLAGMIGTRLGLPEDHVVRLNRGGLLHDIGKIGISREILDKPSRLTDEEYRTIMTHPEIGVKILEPIEAYQDILPMILQHHERYDGSGYPGKLVGEQITLEGRILAVADVYDALSSMRPYRSGWVRTDALDYISNYAGTYFDPEVVAAFRAVVH